MKRSWIMCVTVVLGMVSCGKPVGEKAHGGQQARLVLALFGAPWCTPCKSQFPKIDEALHDELTSAEPRVVGQLYVTTGNTGLQEPTQAVADEYRNFLKIHFEAKADESWKTFRKYVQKDKKIPAAVVFNEQGEALKVFPPGSTTFVPEEIVAYIKERVQAP